jgi:hypothetical protein
MLWLNARTGSRSNREAREIVFAKQNFPQQHARFGQNLLSRSDVAVLFMAPV